jgi:spore maturation protein CgeB
MIAAARSDASRDFVVAGSMYPNSIRWPHNVDRIEHLPDSEHRHFYSCQRFALQLTREDFGVESHSPNARFFEAASCGIPIITNDKNSASALFEPDEEILIAHTSQDILRYLNDLSEVDRKKIGLSARNRVLNSHTAAHRARELEVYILEAMQRTEVLNYGRQMHCKDYPSFHETHPQTC